MELKSIRSICTICGYQLSLHLHELRTNAVFLMLFLYLNGVMSPVKDFARDIEQGISPWVFPVLINDLVGSLVIFSFWCILICNAPFKNEGYLYYVGRTGKRNWIWGEILFLFVFSGIYILIINIFIWIHSLPRLTLTMEWGKTLGTLAYTDASAQIAMPFGFPPSMMSSVSPLMAAVLSFILAWCVAFLLALCVFFINWSFKTSLGVVFALLWVLMDFTVYNLLDWKWARYSPISLAKLSRLLGGFGNMTPPWALLFLSSILVIMLLLIFISAKIRKGIE